MTTLEASSRAEGSGPATDLRRAPFAALRELDLRAPDRDLWDDEAAMWDRLMMTWAGLDDAAWHLPGAAPSDAGGPDWSLAEHVGHVADWQELAIDYTSRAIDTGAWPDDSDYDGGDFDRYNERRREPWASMPRDELLGRLADARPRLLALAHGLSPETIRSDPPWGWLYLTLHGHYLDHLAVIEPWAGELRRRQSDGDPFVADPRPATHAVFAAQEASIAADFDRVVRVVPAKHWVGHELTPGWDLRDHVAHLADWAEEGVRAVDLFEREGRWPADPEEGIDAWNERMVARSRASSPTDVLDRYDAATSALNAAVGRLPVDDLRSPDGWSWAYDCLHGHVRKHLADVGPWCAAIDWAGEER
jgi:hypothetical protein